MLRERVRAHYRALGWVPAPVETIGSGPDEFRPDLVLAKADKLLAVKIDEETLGTYQIGLFGAQVRRARVKGLVVCESSQAVLDACENFGLEFVDSREVGDVVVVPSVARPVPVPLAAPIVAATNVEELVSFTEESRIPLWRWGIVAVIWAAAIGVGAYWLALVT